MSQPLREKVPNIDELPLVESEPLTRSEERMIERYEEIDLKSLERLIDAGKRLVEWGTAAVGIFLAALALLENPKVLQTFALIEVKLLSTVLIVCYLLAVVLGYLASMPRRYIRQRYSITDMSRQDIQMHDRKHRFVLIGSLFFSIGSVMLGVVVILVLWLL